MTSTPAPAPFVRLALALALQWAFALPVLAADPGLPAEAPAASPAPRPIAGCSEYGKCIALGKERLDAKDAPGATAAFGEAVALAGDDLAERAEAYAYLGTAHELGGDYVAALAYTERARATLPQRPAWIEASYKKLLSEHATMSSTDIQRKLKLDQQIAAAESQLQMAEAPVEETPAAAEDGEFTAEMGQVRGIGLDVASNDDNQQYAPKPRRPESHRESKPRPQSSHASQPAHTAKPRARAERAEPAEKPRHHESTRSAAPAKPKHRSTAARASVPSRSAEAPSLDLRINFEYNSAELTEDGIRQADELGKALTELLADTPDDHFLLIGHTDTFGSELYNISLSRERAESVRTYLRQHFPALAEKLSVEGFGERSPIFVEPDEATQKLNRRVEVKVLQ